MSEEKCFCHFGGYAVKDAQARRILSNKATVAALGASIAETTGESGYGNCIVMHDADNCIIFDLGNDDGATLNRYLREKGIRKIDAIYISHFHSDHFQLETLENLIENYTVNNVILPHAAIDWSKINQLNIHHKDAYIAAKNAVETAGINCVEPTEEGDSAAYGEFFVTCHNVSAALMSDYYDWCYNSYYSPTEAENYNNFCMVNAVNFRGQNIVVTGDIMEAAQEKMVDVLSMADLVTVPHHGIDAMISHNLINRLTARHAIIASAFDPNGTLIRTSNAFAGELIRKGCRVTTTYSPGAAVNAVFSIGLAGINPIEPGVLAGKNIYPCILKPGADLSALPDGEFITYSGDHAETILNKPPFYKEGTKFKVTTETTGDGYSTERCQTARTVDTTATPQVAYRNMVTDTWYEWGIQNPAMIVDKEYRTTGFWNGKYVYKKLISYRTEEALSGSTTINVPHGLSGAEIIEVKGKAGAYLLPYNAKAENEVSVCVNYYTATDIVVNAINATWSPRTWHFEVSYTK